MTESKSRWGSLLSGAVAGLESRLDTILADDSTASAKSRAEDEQIKKAKQAENDSRASSKSRSANDRIQARLAKALNTTRDSSDSPTRTRSPSLAKARGSTEIPSRPQSIALKDADADTKDGAAVTSSSTTLTSDQHPPSTDTPPIIETSNGTTAEKHAAGNAAVPIAILGADSEAVEPTSNHLVPLDDTSATDTTLVEEGGSNDLAVKHKEQAEETHRQLEKIDRLHANIAYLSAQLYEKSTQDDAAKDAKIAQLLQEGGNLSKVEEKLRGDIRYLRLRLNEEKQTNDGLTKKLDKLEGELRSLRISVQSAEAREKATNEKLNTLHDVQRELSNVKLEKAEALKELQGLGVLLEQAEQRADDAEKKAQSNKLEEQKKIISDLNDQISDAKIERKLLEDRHAAEVKELKEEHARQLEQANISSLEHKSEIQNLEHKLELLRLQTEESSAGTTGDTSQAKLLRQIETLQSQYALATDNWQGIEAGLNSRITTLEKDRDELARRETEARKKARDLNIKAKKLEEELDSAQDSSSGYESQVAQLSTTVSKLESKLKAYEKDLADARAELLRERKEFESYLQTRLEEERLKWRAELSSGPPTPALDASMVRLDSSQSQRRFDPSGSLRRSHRGSNYPSDVSLLAPSPDVAKSPSRRSLASGQYNFPAPVRTPTDHSVHSPTNGIAAILATTVPSTNVVPPPIIPVQDDVPTLHAGSDSSDIVSPQQRTAAELVSVSTSGAGPSVQLVERMSASVRRLEMEKALAREEIARLAAQRDEARNEVVELMREVEGVKGKQDKVDALEKELAEVKQRYEAVLEMAGEKSEECEELKQDVQDLKSMYRELVERSVKG